MHLGSCLPHKLLASWTLSSAVLSGRSRLTSTANPRLAAKLGSRSRSSSSNKPLPKQSKPTTTSSEMALLPSGIDLDGSIKEGGGQVLRNAAALAAITGTPVRIDKIRANRDRPGLRPQHVEGLKLVAAMCQGQLEGSKVGSQLISLIPRKLLPGKHVADTGTAGSCMLLAQTALPCMLMATGQAGSAVTVVELRGGTDASMAPPVGYAQHVLLPLLRRLLRIDAELEVVRRGFYPKGGGVVRLTATSLASGTCLPSFELLERGEVQCVQIQAFTAGSVSQSAAQEMAEAARRQLRQALGAGVRLVKEVTHQTQETAFGDGGGLLLVAITDKACLLGASALVERKVSAKQAASNATQELLAAIEAGGCTDEWMQDQLIIFMALAKGTSRVLCGELTLHTQTAIVVAERMTGAKFTSARREDGAWLLECQGAAVPAGSTLS